MLRRDQPPYPVESAAPQRFLGDLPVAVVGRTEGAAEQADAGALGFHATVARRPQLRRPQARSEERRLANECVRTSRSRSSPSQSHKTPNATHQTRLDNILLSTLMSRNL